MTKNKTCGVYRITVGRKTYIGSSVDVRRRWRDHLCTLRQGKHRTQHLQRAFNKHGRVKFALLVICAPELRFEYEQRLIDGLKPEMNGTRVARGCIGADPTVVAKAAESRRQFWAENPARRARRSEEAKAVWNDTLRSAQSAATTTLWKNPEFRSKRAAAQRAGQRTHEAFGRLWSPAEAAEHYGVARGLVANRLRAGWSLEQALLAPKGKGGRRVRL